MGADPNYSNHYNMSMLLMTGRFGHDACLRYLCSKLTKEQIDHTSGGLGNIGDADCGHAHAAIHCSGLGVAIGDAAKCGHAVHSNTAQPRRGRRPAPEERQDTAP